MEHRTLLSLPNTVVIDEGEFNRLGIKRIGDTAEIMGRRVLVVGTVSGLRSLAGPYLFCSLDTARTILRPPADQCTFILPKCHNPADAPKVVEKLQVPEHKPPPFPPSNSPSPTPLPRPTTPPP